MASNQKLLARIAELIGRPNNVDYEEIKWVMDQLDATSRTTKHTVMFRIPGNKNALMLNKHNNGKKHLPPYCVKSFCDRMTELGLYSQKELIDLEEERESHEND